MPCFGSRALTVNTWGAAGGGGERMSLDTFEGPVCSAGLPPLWPPSARRPACGPGHGGWGRDTHLLVLAVQRHVRMCRHAGDGSLVRQLVRRTQQAQPHVHVHRPGPEAYGPGPRIGGHGAGSLASGAARRCVVATLEHASVPRALNRVPNHSPPSGLLSRAQHSRVYAAVTAGTPVTRAPRWHRIVQASAVSRAAGGADALTAAGLVGCAP